MGRILAVCSGSGGTGKTTVSVLMAVCAAQLGKRTILLDASGISRACDMMLGIENTLTIDMCDVLSQQTGLQSALYPVPQHPNLRVANASLYEEVPLQELSGVILALQSLCDILIVDLPTGSPGIGSGILTQDDEWLFVLRPDDISIRSTERMIQRVQGSEAGFSLVLNHVRREKFRKSWQYGGDVVAMTLDCRLAASIPEDDSLAQCSMAGRQARLLDSAAASCIRDMLLAMLR